MLFGALSVPDKTVPLSSEGFCPTDGCLGGKIYSVGAIKKISGKMELTAFGMGGQILIKPGFKLGIGWIEPHGLLQTLDRQIGFTRFPISGT
jgi:hypothetical protein